MKPFLRKVVLLHMFLFSIGAHAEEIYSFGLGVGVLYSGLGVNISRRSENDMKYLSAGCISFSSIFGSTCGVGVGWIKTDLFETGSNKHGIGGYIGVIGSGYKYDNRNFNFDAKAKYGVGIGYHYFFNGIDKSGSNIGLTLLSNKAVMLQWGYQF